MSNQATDFGILGGPLTTFAGRPYLVDQHRSTHRICLAGQSTELRSLRRVASWQGRVV